LDRSKDSVEAPTKLPEWRVAMIELFVNGAQLLGLPKSVGQIYGYLYSSETPAPMDQIIADLGISKGSASQGLRFLRQLNAVKLQFVVGERRDHFVAEEKSKKLMGGVIREKLNPALEEGAERIDCISTSLANESELSAFAKDRIRKLETWHKKLKLALPLIQKVLGE